MKAIMLPVRYVLNVIQGTTMLALAVVDDKLVRPQDSYGLDAAIALDCFCNALAGGDPRETISSRSAKARAEGKEWGCLMCTFLGWCASKIAGHPVDHCAQALEPDVGSEAVIKD
jgi:hypothetical protein